MAADVAGKGVWFELPTEHFRGSVADALVCFAFFPAMAQAPGAGPVTVSLPEDLPVSRRLLAALPTQQTTFAAWGRPLTPFNISASETSGGSDDTRIVSSFSGGVDSLYTALTCKEEITHLVHIQGYEQTLDADAEEAGIPRLHVTAARLGKELIVVKTNALSVYRDLKIQRFLAFGVFMATVAHLLGPQRFYVPSSAPLSDLSNEGSHPMTDPRWSSERVDIVYDITNHDRIEKMRRVDEFGYLNDVIVCFNDFKENCCHCIKCVRTMIGIELQDLSRESFKERLTPSHVRRLAPLNGSVGRELFGRYLVLARDEGRRDLVRAMTYAEARHRMRLLILDAVTLIDDLVFGGRITRARQHRAARRRNDPTWFHVIP